MKLVTKDLRPLGNGFIVVVAGLVLVSGRLEAGTSTSQMADPSGYSKLFQAKDGAGNYFWSDTDAFPSATTDYIDTHYTRLYWTSKTFGGKSLTLGVVNGAAPTVFIAGDGPYFFTGGDGLILARTTLMQGVKAKSVKLEGKISVTSSLQNPSVIGPTPDITAADSDTTRILLAGSLSSAVGTALRISGNRSSGNANWGVIDWWTDPSAYYGRLEIQDYGRIYPCRDVTFPGTVSVGNNGEIRYYYDKKWSGMALELKSGGWIWMAQPAVMTTSSFVYGGGLMTMRAITNTEKIGLIDASAGFSMESGVSKVRVAFETSPAVAASTTLRTYGPFLKVPVSSGLTVEDFDITSTPSSGTPLQLPMYDVIQSDAEGVRSFSLVIRPVITQITDDALGECCLARIAGTVDVAAHWSDGQYPHADADYVNESMITRAGHDGGLSAVFAGHSFTLGHQMYLKGERLTISHLRLYSPTYTPNIGQNGVQTNVIDGGTISVDSTANFVSDTYIGGTPQVAASRYLRIDSNLRGKGTLHFSPANASETVPSPCPGLIELTGNNSAYTGQIVMRSSAEDGVNGSILIVSAANALGGPCSPVNTTALKLTGGGALMPKQSLTLDDATRGIWVDRLGRFIVNEGLDLAIHERCRMSGVLRKEGDGLLALGGQISFFDDNIATAPQANSNVIDVVAGSFKPLATNAVDGVAFRFGSQAKLRIDYPATDAATGMFGLYDVRWGTPFDLSANEGRLDVQLDVPDEFVLPKRKFEVPVCTVSDAVPSLTDSLRVTRVRGRSACVVARTIVPGTTTYFAQFAGSGLTIKIK